MSCRDPSDDACAVARHAEHVEGRGSIADSVCPGGFGEANPNPAIYNYIPF